MTHQLLVIKPTPAAGAEPISGNNIENLLRTNSNIRSLVFDENSLRMGITDQEFLRNDLSLPNLRNLMITLRGFKAECEDCKRNCILEIGKLKMPSISNVRIDSLLLRGEEDCARIYFQIFRFLSKYAETIKTLILRHSFKPNSKANLPKIYEFFESLVQGENMDDLKVQLNCLNLEELTIFLDKYEGSQKFDLGLHILSTQKHLTKLIVQVSDSNNTPLFYKTIQLAIENSRDSLRHLTITRSLISSSINDIEDILASLRMCPRMESLRLFVFTIPTFPHPLPPTLRFLDLMGNLHPNLLVEIKNNVPMLEELNFANLSSEYIHLHPEIMIGLRSLVKMPMLRVVKWHFQKFNLDFLRDRPGVVVKISPTNAFASIVYCNLI